MIWKQKQEEEQRRLKGVEGKKGDADFSVYKCACMTVSSCNVVFYTTPRTEHSMYKEYVNWKLNRHTHPHTQ